MTFTLPIREAMPEQFQGMQWIVITRETKTPLGVFLAAADAAQFASLPHNHGNCAIGHARYGWVDMYDRFGTWKEACDEMLRFVKEMQSV